MTRRKKPRHHECLLSWKALMAKLPTMRNEDEVKALLDYELENGQRMSYATRLHSRYTKLRQRRELDAIERKIGETQETETIAS